MQEAPAGFVTTEMSCDVPSVIDAHPNSPKLRAQSPVTANLIGSPPKSAGSRTTKSTSSMMAGPMLTRLKKALRTLSATRSEPISQPVSRASSGRCLTLYLRSQTHLEDLDSILPKKSFATLSEAQSALAHAQAMRKASGMTKTDANRLQDAITDSIKAQRDETANACAWAAGRGRQVVASMKPLPAWIIPPNRR
jgi:hypothetical protein